MTQSQLLSQEQTDVATLQVETETDKSNDLGQRPSSLKSAVKLILEDASCDSLHYLLRSNTSHDGE